MDEKVKIPQKLSKELTDKFVVENNTLKRDVKDNPKDRIQVEIGDSKQADFKPQVKIMRWDNEVNFSLRAEEHPDAVVETNGKVIKYITPEYEVHQYELDPGDIGEDGGLEFEWILPQKPASNILTATIQTKGLNFFFQPPLTPEEIAEGVFRPENVEGSYAVYHSTKGGMNDSAGMEYKTGKAFHIYRPKAIDGNGQETWCDLNVDTENGLLTVTVPQKFLDDAVYPVRVDPTFGYTSLGGTAITGLTSVASDISRLVGQANNLSEDATLDSISVGIDSSGAGFSLDLYFALYREASGGVGTHAKVASVESLDQAIISTPAFVTINAASEALTADDYIIAALGNGEDNASINANLMADTTGGGSNKYSEFTSGAGSYATRKAEDPWTETATNDNDFYSIYATYTAAGGGGASPSGPSMTTNTSFWGS